MPDAAGRHQQTLEQKIERLEIENAQLEEDKRSMAEKFMECITRRRELEAEGAETSRSVSMLRQSVKTLKSELDQANLLVGLSDSKLAGFQVVHAEKGHMPAGLDHNDVLTTAAMVQVLETEYDSSLQVTPVYRADVTDDAIVLGPLDLYS